jgi:predicted RNA-binding protein YlqC (UPF0109 family)
VKVEFDVPVSTAGRIIGKQGSTIREIKSLSGADVQVREQIALHPLITTAKLFFNIFSI